MVDEAEGRRRAVIGRGSEKAEKPVSGCGRRVRNWLSLADRREWEVVKTRERMECKVAGEGEAWPADLVRCNAITRSFR